METETQTPAPVVDFAQYRAERAQRRLDFDRVPQPQPIYMGEGAHRTLTTRDINHRARMLAFLGGRREGQRSKVKG